MNLPYPFVRLLTLAALALPTLAQAPVEAVHDHGDQTIMLRLRSGQILWGSIVAHDPETLEFHRLENGGHVSLPWGLLDPDEENELRLRFGYVDAVVEEVMTKADRFVLDDGTEIIGVVLGRTDDFINVKRASGMQPVPKRRLAGSPTMVQVPALDIFTKEELYQNRVFEQQSNLNRSGTPGARAHYEMAQYCERLFDFAHALHHYKIADKLDPTFNTDMVQGALARTELKAANQEQVDHLAEIDLWRARKQYQKALALVQSFPSTYPNSPLMEDWNKMRERLGRAQEADLRDQVVKRWHYWANALAKRIAREVDSYEGATALADEGLGEELLQNVHADLAKIAPEITIDEVRKLWDERKGGRFRQASYGLGTWLLGKDRARAELEKEEDGDAPAKGSAAEARQKYEERLKRYFENQTIARKAASGQTSEADDPEVFWKDWKVANRAQWILAYYVENSGDFSVERVRFSNCRECGGTGTREIIFTGGAISGSTSGLQIVPCPTCHTVAVVRRVRYR